MSIDLAAALLRRAVRTLPVRQGEWGAAMCAELADLADPAERWRFAVGCTHAVLRRPTGLLAVARGLAGVAVLATVGDLAWAIGVPQVRVEALAVVAVLGLMLAVLRSRIAFGPVAAARSARLVAAGGLLVLAVEVMLEFRQLRIDPPLMLPMNATLGVFDPDRARAHLVELTVLLAILLVGLARVTADRAAVRASTIATAGTAAAVMTGAWLAVVLVRPETAASAGPALLAAAGAVLVAGGRLSRPAAPAGDGREPNNARQSMIGGLLTAAVTTAALGLLMDLLPLTGRWVANNAPPDYAVPPPTRVAETAAIWLPCILLSIALTVTVRRCKGTALSNHAAGQSVVKAPVSQ